MYVTIKLDDKGYKIHSILDRDKEIVTDKDYFVMPWNMVNTILFYLFQILKTYIHAALHARWVLRCLKTAKPALLQYLLAPGLQDLVGLLHHLLQLGLD